MQRCPVEGLSARGDVSTTLPADVLPRGLPMREPMRKLSLLLMLLLAATRLSYSKRKHNQACAALAGGGW